MKKLWKRIISIFLFFVMAQSLLPVNRGAVWKVHAAETYTITKVVSGNGDIDVVSSAEAGAYVNITAQQNVTVQSIAVTTDSGEIALEGTNGSYGFRMPASNVTVTAALSPAPHSPTLTVEPAGAGTAIYDPATNMITATPTSDRWVFSGWKSSTGTITSANVISTSNPYGGYQSNGDSILNEPVYIAVYKERKYPIVVTTNKTEFVTVSYSMDGLVINGVHYFAKGEVVTVSAGYLSGYYSVTSLPDGTMSGQETVTYTIESMPAESVTITIEFSPETFALQYYANGGTLAAASYDRLSTNGESYIKDFNVETPTFDLAVPTKEGYLFGGWYTSSDFSGNSITQIPNGSYDDLTLYARWITLSESLSVSFSAGSGSGTMSHVSMTAGSYTLPECSFTAPSGMEFAGWQVGEDTYLPGESISVSADTTVTALWKQSPVPLTVDLTGTSAALPFEVAMSLSDLGEDSPLTFIEDQQVLDFNHDGVADASLTEGAEGEPSTLTPLEGMSSLTQNYEYDLSGLSETYSTVTFKVIREHVHAPTLVARVEPTCTEGGSEAYYTCTCGKFFSDAEGLHEIEEGSWALDPTDHDWNDPVYTWDADFLHATASRTCKNDTSHTESETVATTTSVTTEPTCTDSGVKTWTAQFTKNQFSTQTKELSLTPLGHDWNEPIYAWSEDYSTVIVTFICRNNSSHTGTFSFPGEIDVMPTCGSEGVAISYIEIKNSDLSIYFYDEPGIVLQKNGEHSWNEPTYTWSDDFSSVTASRTCKNNSKHIETETVSTVASVTIEPTVDPEGSILWTASFSNPVFVTQTKTQVLSQIILPVYKNINDNKLQYKTESKEPITIRISRNIDDNTTLDHFTGAEVDGITLTSADASIRKGSVIIELQPAYLNTLSVGKHTLTAYFDDAEPVSVEFEILAKTPSATPAPKASVTAKTSDPTDLSFWITTSLSAIALVIAVLFFRRKFTKQ